MDHPDSTSIRWARVVLALLMLGFLIHAERGSAAEAQGFGAATGPSAGPPALPGGATAASPLWVNIRLDSLPRQLTLCRDLAPGEGLSMAVNGDREYSWGAAIDVDGNPATGSVDGYEAALSIYATDPEHGDEYFIDCSPHAVDTDKALKAVLTDLRPDEHGAYLFTTVEVPLVIHFADATLSVALDRGLAPLAALSPGARFALSAAGTYEQPCEAVVPDCQAIAYAFDNVASLTLGPALPATVSDPAGDTTNCRATSGVPDTSWCGILDVVGVRLSDAASVPSLVIDSTFSGAWYDPAQSGHGLMIEVLPDSRLLAFWFSFNPEGTQQAWFGGVGSYGGDTATIAPVLQTTGGRWLPNFDPGQVVSRDWGTFELKFHDHDHGVVEFASSLGYGAGSMPLTRLSRPIAYSALEVAVGAPGAVTADGAGNVYFSSTPDRVYKLDATGVLTRIAGTGVPGYSGDGGPATQAQLNFPFSYPELEQNPIDYTPLVAGLATDAAGNLYIADAYNNRVRRIAPDGTISTVAGNGARANNGDGGAATAAAVYWPQGVARDATGTLYVTSAFGPLRRVGADGTIGTLAGANCGANFLAPGLCVPEQIAVDHNRNVYVPDAYCRVRRVQPGGAVSTIAGDDTHPRDGLAFTCGYSGDGGPATSAALSNAPYAVAVDAGGNVYIADTYNSCVRKVSVAGIISTFAGACTAHGFAGDNGPATAARLNHPYGVAVDAAGNVLIADTGNGRIRKVSADGNIRTIAGSGGTSGIGPAHSGIWYDPAQSGHGLFVEVLPDSRLLAWWFAFNPEGTEQSWFGGLGTYSGANGTIPNVVRPVGGRWIPNFDETQVVNQPWGSFNFTFSDCRHGRVDYQSGLGYGSGSMTLTHLTQLSGSTCP